MKRFCIWAVRTKAGAKLFAIAFFVLALLIPGSARVPVAQAYVTANAHWADHDLPVMVNLDWVTSSLGSITPEEVKAEIIEAMNAWNSVGTPFRFVEGRGANPREEVRIAIVPPTGDYRDLEDDFAGTRFVDENLSCAPLTSELRGACIAINESANFKMSCWPSFKADLQSVVLHELGHALGLAHTQWYNYNYAIMWKGSSASDQLGCLREPLRDDIAGLKSLYGRETDTSPAATPQLIWPGDQATIMTAQIDATTQFRLNWEDSSDTVSYYVQVSESDDFLTHVFRDNPTQSFAGFTPGPSTGTTYFWRVKAKGTGSNSPWSEIRRFAILLLPLELYEQSEFPILEPGEDAEIYFALQNTGSQTWEARHYALVNVNDLPLGARPQMALNVDVPPGSAAVWRFSVTAPTVPGIFRTEWQFSYDGQLLGPLLWMDFIVVPGGGDDLEEIIREMIEEARRRGEEWFREQWEELRRQIIELIWAEMMRQIEQFFAEWCGGSAATGALSFAALWLGRRRSRGRRRRASEP